MTTPQVVFDWAAQFANRCLWARLGYKVWETDGLPVRVRKAGMEVWNRHYVAALPPHLRGTKYR